LLLTPSTVDIKPDEKRKKARTEYRKSVGRQWTLGSLTEQIYHGLLPTPTASDEKGGRSDENPRKDHNPLTNNLRDCISHLDKTGKSSQLNPQFVAEMMGFPTDWTALPFQNGATNQLKDTETQ